MRLFREPVLLDDLILGLDLDLDVEELNATQVMVGVALDVRELEVLVELLVEVIQKGLLLEVELFEDHLQLVQSEDVVLFLSVLTLLLLDEGVLEELGMTHDLRLLLEETLVLTVKQLLFLVSFKLTSSSLSQTPPPKSSRFWRVPSCPSRTAQYTQ